MKMDTFMSNVPYEYKISMKFFLEHEYKGEVNHQAKYEGFPIVGAAQGICKYANSEYALSIKQTLETGYADIKPISLPNGGFLYAYHQQGDGTKDKLEKLAYNRALYKNVEDQIPIGIWYQTKPKGRGGAKYLIYTGLPIAWIDGFFIIVIPSETGEIEDSFFEMSPRELLNIILEQQILMDTYFVAQEPELFDPNRVIDERKKVMRHIVQRQGQPIFRKSLLTVYEGVCSVTGCDVLNTLEAARITPYWGDNTNKIQNGLLLRCDIHNLWNYGMIYVDSSTMTIVLHPDLQDGYYGELQGKKLKLPKNSSEYPAKSALDAHREACCF